MASGTTIWHLILLALPITIILLDDYLDVALLAPVTVSLKSILL